MRVVIAGIGTRGDLQPLLLLGRALVDRGHDALVCGPPDFLELAGEVGVPFRPMGRPFKELLGHLQTMFEKHPIQSLHGAIAKDLVFEQAEALPAFVPGADMLIGNGVLVAGASVAEAAGIPYMLALLQPVVLRASDYPPPFMPKQDLPRWINRPLWDFYRIIMNTAFRKHLNDWRKTIGLSPVADITDHVYSTSNFLLALDPVLTGPLPRWDFPHVVTGYWQDRDTDIALPGDLEAFLAAGTPPVYVGFGSMTSAEVAERTGAILEAVRQAGQRAFVSAGWAGLGEAANLPEGCMAIGPVSHAALFPRCRAIVHHGGAGTTAAAALAGRPQVVVPHLLDQHYWAHRVEKCGLGPKAFTVHKLTASRLSAALGRACDNPAYRERAEAVSRELWRRDGLAEAVAAIEAKILN